MATPRDIPTAPRDVIGDDGDLRLMRDALRAGKRATLASDGKVYVSAEAGSPMTEEQEAWIESKLGHVIELARSGYGVTVQPDGEMSAHRADHRSIVLYDPDPNLSEQQRLLIERAISEGAQVRIHSDGRVEYTRFDDSTPPTGEVAAEMRAVLEAEIDSGRLVAALQGGQTLDLSPRGDIGYITTAPGPEPVLFPEDRKLLDSVNATPEDFEEEALGLEVGAGAARMSAHEDFLAATRAATAKASAADRDRVAAEATATQANRQAQEADTRANEFRHKELEAWKQADAAKATGDTALAAEATEMAQGLAVRATAARLEAEDARAAAATATATATRLAGEKEAFDAERTAAQTRAKEYEDILDQQEQQAAEYRTAAAELREAKRLEAELPDLEARSVPGVERVRQAAAEHRRLAQEAAERGNAYDAPTPPVTPIAVGPDDNPFGGDSATAASPPAEGHVSSLVDPSFDPDGSSDGDGPDDVTDASRDPAEMSNELAGGSSDLGGVLADPSSDVVVLSDDLTDTAGDFADTAGDFADTASDLADTSHDVTADTPSDFTADTSGDFADTSNDFAADAPSDLADTTDDFATDAPSDFSDTTDDFADTSGDFADTTADVADIGASDDGGFDASSGDVG
ncbi:hypothetical protein [Desertimonas flava]|uniref:hypothetical protein n=1 Tax=Desertimonas flava TaxID=2064846 RepID=UPI0013C466FB|nr:hypothetical protein [Desertimonas flava]